MGEGSLNTAPGILTVAFPRSQASGRSQEACLKIYIFPDTNVYFFLRDLEELLVGIYYFAVVCWPSLSFNNTLLEIIYILLLRSEENKRFQVINRIVFLTVIHKS